MQNPSGIEVVETRGISNGNEAQANELDVTRATHLHTHTLKRERRVKERENGGAINILWGHRRRKHWNTNLFCSFL